MNLDKRIVRKPFDCFDVEQTKAFIGKKGYFSDQIEHFESITHLSRGTLKYVDLSDSIYPYEILEEESNIAFRYFLPLEYVS